MKIDNPTQLTAGSTIFWVGGFGGRGRGHVCTIEVIAVENVDEAGGQLWFNGTIQHRHELYDKGWNFDVPPNLDIVGTSLTTRRSLRDAGIVPNEYNYHAVFDSLDDAIAYADANRDKAPLALPYEPTFGEKQLAS